MSIKNEVKKVEEGEEVVVDVKAAVPRESAFVKKMMWFVLVLVFVLVVPLYLYREAQLVRAIADAPISRVILFGEPLDPVQLAERLNADGKLIDMADVVARTNDSCTSAQPLLPKGKMTAVTFTVGNTERHGVVYIPNSYPDSNNIENGAAGVATAQPVPLMVLFHGLNDNCEHFLNATGFLPYAEKHGIAIASACGSQGYLGTAWNSGMCCGFSGEEPDDIGFAQLIVSTMRQAICVDERKVMAVGFSNGAMLAEVLACEAPDVFQAAVSIGGVVELRPGNAEGLARCTEKVQAKPQHRASVLMVHGTSDVMVPWGGNKLLGFPSIETNVVEWAARNGCEMEQTNSTIHTQTYTNTIYSACDAATTTAYPILAEEMETAEAPVVQHVAAVVREQTVMLADDDNEDDDAEEAVVEAGEAAAMKKHHRKHPDHPHPHPHRHHHHHHKKDDKKGAEDKKDKKKDKKKGKHGPPPHPPHGPHHHPGHGPHHGDEHEEGPKGPQVCPMKPPVAAYPGSAVSQIELVRVEGGAHRWPEDDQFSTTDYIIEFGARVFGGYTF